MTTTGGNPPKQRKRKYSEQEVADALRQSAGNNVLAGRLLNCGENLIRYYIGRSEFLQGVCEDIRKSLIPRYGTKALGGLCRAIDRDEPWAIKFMLEREGPLALKALQGSGDATVIPALLLLPDNGRNSPVIDVTPAPVAIPVPVELSTK